MWNGYETDMELREEDLLEGDRHAAPAGSLFTPSVEW